MTVNTTNITSGPYVGNGLNDEYSYTFRVEDKTQLSVYETDDLGVQTLLIVDVHYTVAGIGNDAGGTITRVAGNLPTNYQWYVRSNYIENQLTAFASQGGFFPDVHEAQMDHITFLIQQLRDTANRSFRLTDIIDIDGDFKLNEDATIRLNKVLGFDNNGDLITTAFTDAALKVYLGSKTSDPTTDNQGDPLIDGALYYNTTTNVMKVYDLGTTTWLVINPSNQAVDIAVADTGDLYEGTNVESILQETNPAHHFRVRAKSTPDLTVNVAAGVLQKNKTGPVSGDFTAAAITEVAAQSITGATVPGAGNERYFHIVIDRDTGVASRNNGIEAPIGSASLPALQDNEIVLAEVHLTYPENTIQPSNIRDLRPGFHHWRTDGKVFLGTVAVTGNPTRDLLTFSTDFDCYEFHFQNVYAAAAAVLSVELHQQGGSWLTGASDYDYASNHSTTPASTASFPLTGNSYTGSPQGNGILRVYNPLAVAKTGFMSNISYENFSGNIVEASNVGKCNLAVACDQIRMRTSIAGPNMVGKCHIYGVRSN